MDVVTLKPGREKSVHNRHPWIFSGAIQRIAGHPADGDVVQVQAADGSFLAYGYLNRQSQITIRLLSWNRDEAIDAEFFRRRLQRAIAGRADLRRDQVSTNAYRLVHAESDLLPGLIVDYYAGYLSVQILTLGIERWKEMLIRLLVELLDPRGIVERSDVDVREKEGLPETVGLLTGESPPDWLEIREHGLRFWVDLLRGQKTGFYLDQRENRAAVARYAAGRAMLNAFSFSGGFGIYAAAAGANPITNVDASSEALAQAEANFRLNGLEDRDIELVEGDVFQVLRQFREAGRQFDLVVLDPPKFAYRRDQVERACRGYKDINMMAMQLLRPDSILATFSCSGLVTADLFQKVVFSAAVDAQRDVQILEPRAQAPDHPVLLSFPEGAYLKGLICRVL